MAEAAGNRVTRVTVNITSGRGSRRGSFLAFVPLSELIEFPAGMTQAQLEELPKVKITKQQADELIQCGVCLDEFKLNEEIRKLPCNHMYHDQCIFPWLQNNHTCPACRQPLHNSSQPLRYSISNTNGDDLQNVIRQHFARLNADLIRYLAETRGILPTLWSAANRPAEERLVGDVRSSANPVRRVPQRTAALRARRAIQQFYR